MKYGDNNVALIGLGPHAKRIYINYFKNHNINFSLLVELESEKKEAIKYLSSIGFSNVKVFPIENKYKDNDILPKFLEEKLDEIFSELNINFIIISTEPKAHNMYLTFALKHNINVLSDKPITVCKNMTSLKNIKTMNKQYYQLLKLLESSKSKCVIMCQRKYHYGYIYIKELLNSVVKKYGIPITFIEIYHCDGNWELPHDLNKENHPYKYGYGKLFHSGYHFIDLLSDFLKINDQLDKKKQIVSGEVYANCFTPKDELAVCDFDDIKRLFKNQEIPCYYENPPSSFNKYGEKNFYGLLKFKNSNNMTITTASVNLLHYGFSRRGWIQSKNYYKENGRIRHEHINIQVGPLMNIQVHSYQSKEIKDRSKSLEIEESPGGLEHFDIEIFRNSDIIGGKSYEKIKLGDLYSTDEKKKMLGFNEKARESLLNSFFNDQTTKSDLKSHILGIEILTSCATQIHNCYKQIKKPTEINFNNRNKYIDFEYLKKFQYIENVYQSKKLIKIFSISKNKYEFGIVINFINLKKNYEIYIYITDNNNIVSKLLYKNFNNYFLMLFYYYYLHIILTTQKISKIVKIILNNN